MVRFTGYSEEEVSEELKIRLEENESSSVLTIMSGLEASFRIDYLQRCYKKEKDGLSREFRDMYKQYESSIRLEDGILSAWKNQMLVDHILIGNIRGAFKYRHWLAHGRYWTPKLGQKYDYDSVYLLAEEVYSTFPFIDSES
ncbi:hypothetical protein [Armatimonas sp.]|uniref:hypothetical protein n=1 Tax=Armatimonas sp. TaxID=1872638 RepID=UPI00375311D0